MFVHDPWACIQSGISQNVVWLIGPIYTQSYQLRKLALHRKLSGLSGPLSPSPTSHWD